MRSLSRNSFDSQIPSGEIFLDFNVSKRRNEIHIKCLVQVVLVARFYLLSDFDLIFMQN